MGNWGSGSFENDYALNILGEFSHELSAGIEKLSGLKDSAEYDEYNCDKLIVDMEIYLALAAQKLPMENHPDPEILTKNLPKFEQVWKAYTEKSGLDLNDRLKHIKRLWNRVIKVARKLRIDEDDDC